MFSSEETAYRERPMLWCAMLYFQVKRIKRRSKQQFRPNTARLTQSQGCLSCGTCNMALEGSSTTPRPTPPSDASILNELVDILLEDFIYEYGEQYDPLMLPSGLEITPRVKLVRGTLYGLSGLKRKGDCYVVYSDTGIVATANLALTKLSTILRMKATLLHVGPTLDAWAQLDECQVQMVVNLTDSARPQLTSFRIKELRGLEITVAGLGLLDVPLNKIVRTVVRMTTNQVKRALEVRVRDVLEAELEHIPMLFRR